MACVVSGPKEVTVWGYILFLLQMIAIEIEGPGKFTGRKIFEFAIINTFPEYIEMHCMDFWSQS